MGLKAAVMDEAEEDMLAYMQLPRKHHGWLHSTHPLVRLNGEINGHTNVSGIRTERLHELSGQRRNQFAVDLAHPYQLVFLPNHKPLPKRDTGGIDATRVTSITVVEIVDYH